MRGVVNAGSVAVLTWEFQFRICFLCVSCTVGHGRHWARGAHIYSGFEQILDGPGRLSGLEGGSRQVDRMPAVVDGAAAAIFPLVACCTALGVVATLRRNGVLCCFFLEQRGPRGHAAWCALEDEAGGVACCSVGGAWLYLLWRRLASRIDSGGGEIVHGISDGVCLLAEFDLTWRHLASCIDSGCEVIIAAVCVVMALLFSWRESSSLELVALIR